MGLPAEQVVILSSVNVCTQILFQTFILGPCRTTVEWKFLQIWSSNFWIYKYTCHFLLDRFIVNFKDQIQIRALLCWTEIRVPGKTHLSDLLIKKLFLMSMPRIQHGSHQWVAALLTTEPTRHLHYDLDKETKQHE